METTGITVTALAQEFGLNVVDMLDLCEMFGVAAPSVDAVLRPEGVELLRGVASGTVDPDSIVLPTPTGTGPAPEQKPAPEDEVAAPKGRRRNRTGTRRLPFLGGSPDLTQDTGDRRAAGESIPDVHTTSWWDRHFGRTHFDGYVPRWLRLVYVASVVIVLVGLWLFFRGPSDGGDQVAPSVLPTAPPGLEIGSCFNADAGLWLDGANVVACAGPHDAQAIAIVELTPAARSYPSLADLRSEATVLCIDHLRGIVTLGDSQVIGASVPPAQVWQAGDQRVLCNVVDGSGEKLVGSVL